jgi:hypothetical protein
MGRAAGPLVGFIERRKGDGQPTLDRRRTYIDVVERVLGSTLPSDVFRPNGFFTRFEVGQSIIGSTVSAVEIHLLDELDGIITSRKDN